MKTKTRINTINDVETELEIILSCNRKPRKDLTIAQVFDFIAESIESSMQENKLNDSGLFQRLFGKYQLKKLLANGGFKSEGQIYNFPSPGLELDIKISESRLKTAITAFKLHSGPFGNHPTYGELDKEKWEKILSYTSAFLFSYIELENDEKIRFLKEKEFKKEKLAEEKNGQKYSNESKNKNHHHNNHNNHKNKKWKHGKRPPFKKSKP